MLQVASRLELQFGFEYRFFTCPIGRASKIVRPKSRVPKKKFVHPWQITLFCHKIYIFDFHLLEAILKVISTCKTIIKLLLKIQ